MSQYDKEPICRPRPRAIYPVKPCIECGNPGGDRYTGREKPFRNKGKCLGCYRPEYNASRCGVNRTNQRVSIKPKPPVPSSAREAATMAIQAYRSARGRIRPIGGAA